MKRILACLLLAALLAGCTPAAPTGSTAPAGALSLTPGQSWSDHAGITLEYRGVQYDGSDITLQLCWRNRTAHDAVFGASYTIERLEDGQWVSCAKVDDVIFIALAYELPAFWKQNESYTLTEQFDLSQPGTYRFRTDCSVIGSTDGKTELGLEFTLSQGQPATEAHPITPGRSYSDYAGVSISVQDIVPGDSGQQTFHIQWQNSTGFEAVFGEAYTVEHLEDGQWVSCIKADDIGFNDLGYILSAGQTREETYAVTNIYDISQPGRYRFRTDCSISDPAHPDAFDLWITFTVGQTADLEPLDIPFAAQYIRTNGDHAQQYPQLILIRTAQELAEYYEANKEAFDLERKEQVYSDTTIGFLDACDAYDDTFFETKYLAMVLLSEGSGSIRHQVTNAQLTVNDQLALWVDTIIPEAGTSDMAQWHLLVELDKAYCVSSSADVLLYLDGTLTLGQPPALTDTTAVLQEPPVLTLQTADNTQAAKLGLYDWSHQVGEDTWSTVICDHQHPLYCQNVLSPLVTTQDSLQLVFDEIPDSLSVQCWPDTAWESNAPSQKTDLYGATLTLKPGGYIYSISAKWNESDQPWHGSADYYVYAIVQDSHTHGPAAIPETAEDPVTGYCGNTVTKLELDGQAYAFMYDQSVTLTDTLINLAYTEEKLCRCLSEYTVHTEWGTYEVNLTQGFARCQDGQANLTQAQIDTIQNILDWARTTKPQM